ncbi:MAG: hypothetical protein WC102_03105 [Saccharofermentanales bacterium]
MFTGSEKYASETIDEISVSVTGTRKHDEIDKATTTMSSMNVKAL